MAFEDILIPEKGESEFKEILENFFNNDKYLEGKTELTDAEIKEIAKITFFLKLFKIPNFRSFLYEFMRLRISFKREGRREFVNSIKPADSNTLKDNLLSFLNSGSSAGVKKI